MTLALTWTIVGGGVGALLVLSWAWWIVARRPEPLRALAVLVLWAVPLAVTVLPATFVIWWSVQSYEYPHCFYVGGIDISNGSGEFPQGDNHVFGDVVYNLNGQPVAQFVVGQRWCGTIIRANGSPWPGIGRQP